MRNCLYPEKARESRMRRRASWIECHLHKSRRPFLLRGIRARYYLVRHGEIVAGYKDLDAVERDFDEAGSEISEARDRCLERRYSSKSR